MIFRRKKSQDDPADGARKCHADMAVDQHMLLDGFIQTSPARVEMQLRPGEVASEPSTVIYINPSRPAPTVFVATILVDGLHPEKAEALRIQDKLLSQLDSFASSPQIAADIRSTGYVPLIIKVDLKHKQPTIDVEELSARPVT